MMRKKIVLCLAVAGLLAVGCGKSEEKADDPSSVQVQSEVESSSEKTEDGSSEKAADTEKDTDAEKDADEKNTDAETDDDKEKDTEKDSDIEDKADVSSDKKSGDGELLDKDNGKTLDKIFENCSMIGEGVAGTSLKRTKQAYIVAKYAAKNKFTETSLPKLKAAFKERYEKLDSDGKESFDGAFDGEIIYLLDEAIVNGNFESVKGQFDDVGAAEKMEKILERPGLKTSWNVIKEAYEERAGE